MFLIIDTSSKKSLALLVSKKSIKKNIWDADFRHSEKLLPKISKLIGNSGLKKIKGLGVVSGPGSYTGLRVGTAVANALGYAQNIPLADINKFEWLAHLGIDNISVLKNNTQVCAVISAIHDQIFAGIYKFSRKGNEFTLKEPNIFFTGNANQLCKAILKPTVFSVENTSEIGGIINKNILKKNIGNNFIDIKFFNLYSESGIGTLSDMAGKKFNKRKFKKIIRPLYVHKPNITRA